MGQFVVEAVYLMVAAAAIFFVRENPEIIDRVFFHNLLWMIDTLILSLVVYFAGNLKTEVYLLYLIPIISVAHFNSRMQASWQTGIVVVAYLFSLLNAIALMAERPDFLSFLGTWVPRSIFIIASAWLYRMQRHLPEPEETLIISPSELKFRIEQEMEEYNDLIDFDSASLQLLYRDRLQIVACIGFPEPEKLYRVEFPVDDPRFPNRKVLESKEVIVVDTSKYPPFSDDLYHAAHIRTWMGAPLISPSTREIFGMLSLDSTRIDAFDNQDKQNADLFAKELAATLIESALAPAAMTLAAKQNNQESIMRTWARKLSSLKADWNDDLVAARDLVEICADIFNVEDCSAFFVRPNQETDDNPKVMHLVASTAIPEESFTNNECIISGQFGTGLTGYAVYRQKVINYGANEIRISPFRGNYLGHLKHLESRVSKQIMIAPLVNTYGRIIGALKVENRLGWPSESRFPLFQQHLFEAFADLFVQTIENIRMKNYIARQQQSVHNIRAIMAGGVLNPMDRMIRSGVLEEYNNHQDEVTKIRTAIGYIANTMDRILADPGDILTLENEGLIPALIAFLDYMSSGFPPFEDVYRRIIIHPGRVRDSLPFPVRAAFYNVGREALINILRHSGIHEIQDGQAEVIFDGDGSIYTMTIFDNGVGFSIPERKAAAKCYGMLDMEKQIKGIDSISKTASFVINSMPSEGTRIEVLWEPK
ncbi:MAG: hypothetical protein JW757_04190 [Anaerolineales bacterium]|nr:hypothetical protein [Anaerolineales bacterium]